MDQPVAEVKKATVAPPSPPIIVRSDPTPAVAAPPAQSLVK